MQTQSTNTKRIGTGLYYNEVELAYPELCIEYMKEWFKNENVRQNFELTWIMDRLEGLATQFKETPEKLRSPYLCDCIEDYSEEMTCEQRRTGLVVKEWIAHALRTSTGNYRSLFEYNNTDYWTFVNEKEHKQVFAKLRSMFAEYLIESLIVAANGVQFGSDKYRY